METIGVPELLILVVIVILLFGVGRISKIGGELGGGIRAFREGLRGDEPAPAHPAAEPAQPEAPAPESKDGLT